MLWNAIIAKWYAAKLPTRQIVGPFAAPGTAGALAASQSNLDCRYVHPVSDAATGFVAPRGGSITGLSVQLTAAVTGTGEDVVVSVTKNGTETDLSVTLTADGAEETAYATLGRGALAFDAGDVLGISYTSGSISNTPAMVASIEIEA